jgi:hypothetical protein
MRDRLRLRPVPRDHLLEAPDVRSRPTRPAWPSLPTVMERYPIDADQLNGRPHDGQLDACRSRASPRRPVPKPCAGTICPTAQGKEATGWSATFATRRAAQCSCGSRGRRRVRARAGKWTDAATGEHGDLLDVIRESMGLIDFKDVAKEARDFLAMPGVLISTQK